MLLTLNLIEILKTLFLGIVEGITEWLPISSTGHLILVDEFLKMKQNDEFMNVFNVVIQLGAILAVVVLYWSKLWPFHLKKNAPKKSWFVNEAKEGFLKSFQTFCNNYCYMDKIVMWIKIVCACIPAIIMGPLFDDWMEKHLMNGFVVACMLVLYGILFIVIENYNKTRTPKVNTLKEIDFKTAFGIGLFQVLSLVPGTSRSGSTIIGGILLGVSREMAAEFTFFLGIPVMFGASFLKLFKFGLAFTSAELIILLIGMVTAFLVSIVVIKWLMGYIKKHDFKVFGWYRIVLGILVLAYFIFIK